MSDTSAPAASALTAPVHVSWWIDGAIALLLCGTLAALRPAVPDGDGWDHTSRAVESGFLEGMMPKHLIYAAVLRGVFLAIGAIGLRRYTLEAFTFVSNLAGAFIYLLLARLVFPKFLRDPVLTRLCAAGTLLSIGVLQACCAIETYALALAVDVALVAVCLRGDLGTWWGGISAGVLFVAAVATHVTNVLLLPFVLVFLFTHARRRHWLAVGWFAGIVLIGAVLLAVGVLVGQGASAWPPDIGRLIPRGDPEPPMGVGTRLGRAAYGFVRTVAWLPPSWELTTPFVLGYGAAFALTALLVLIIARRGFLQRIREYQALAAMSLLVVIPFTALGLMYFSSDPERWLFLMPVLWLWIGIVWQDYRPEANGWLSQRAVQWALAGIVLALGTYNILAKQWPASRHDRGLAGAQALSTIARPGDVVIAMNAIGPLYQEFVLSKPVAVEFEPLNLLIQEYPDAVRPCQEELRRRIRAALASGRRVLVLGLFDEGLTAGRGYPWALVFGQGYTPHTFLSVLQEFQPQSILESTSECPGIRQLLGGQGVRVR
jgi:hypothetical protein